MEVPRQIIFMSYNMPVVLRLNLTYYGKRVIASYQQINEKGEEIHMFNYKSGYDEETVKQELYLAVLEGIKKFEKTNTNGDLAESSVRDSSSPVH